MSVSDKYLHSSALDVAQISRALSVGQLSGTAEIVEEYERELASSFKSSYAIAVSSGSTALQAAFVALGLQPGDEVLVPAIAPLPSVFPLTLNGLKPVAVDTGIDNLGFDPTDLLRKINGRTKAALLVPLWGYPIDPEPWASILEEKGIPLVEDAAHAHGSKYGAQFVGTLGAIGCFSTHDRKLLSTGEGGFLLTDSPSIAARVREYSRLGNLKGRQFGANFKLGALAAALGLARLPDLENQIEIRRKNAAHVKDRLGENYFFNEIHHPVGCRSNYYNLVYLINKSRADPRGILRQINDRGLNVDQIKYGYDVFYRREVYFDGSISCPNAESLVSRAFQVPVHPGLANDDLTKILEILSRSFDE